MADKLAKIDELLDSGFSVDEITSDDTLDVKLSQGEATVTIRFSRDDIAELWPRLFPSASEVDTPATDVPEMTPYGAEAVAVFLQRDVQDLD